jgi:hypothetical protein
MADHRGRHADAGAGGDQPGGALPLGAASVAAGVDVAVVGDDEERPLFVVVREPGAYGVQQAAHACVGPQHRGVVRVPAAEDVRGLVGSAEVDEGRVQVVAGEDACRLLGDPFVAGLPGLGVVRGRGDIGGPGRRAEEGAAVAYLHERLPARRDEAAAAVLLGDAGGEVGEDIEAVAGEVVAPHPVLVDAHSGDDRRPARAGHGGGALVDLDRCEEAVGRQGVQARGGQTAQRVEAYAVDADDQDTVDGVGHGRSLRQDGHGGSIRRSFDRSGRESGGHGPRRARLRSRPSSTATVRKPTRTRTRSAPGVNSPWCRCGCTALRGTTSAMVCGPAGSVSESRRRWALRSRG